MCIKNCINKKFVCVTQLLEKLKKMLRGVCEKILKRTCYLYLPIIVKDSAIVSGFCFVMICLSSLLLSRLVVLVRRHRTLYLLSSSVCLCYNLCSIMQCPYGVIIVLASPCKLCLNMHTCLFYKCIIFVLSYLYKLLKLNNLRIIYNIIGQMMAIDC